jgi:hypothetical protein
MIALTTAASTSGTVAWFIANGTVTASTMQFKATAGANLFIGKGQKDLASLEAQSIDNLGVDVSLNGISPCEIGDISGTAGSKTVPVKTPSSYSNDPTVGSAGKAGEYTSQGTISAIAATEEANVAKYAAVGFVTLARKQTATGNTFTLATTVTVTCPNSSNINKALRAGMLINDKFYQSNDANSDGTSSITLTVATTDALSDNTAYNAALVIWYSGEDSDCFVNNAVNIAANTASWKFTSSNYSA